MKSRSAGVATLAVLGVLAWLGWGWLDAPPPPRSAPHDAGSGAPSVASARLDGASAPAPEHLAAAAERTAAEPPAAATWVVRGELMHGSVAPLPATSFVARLHAGAATDGEPLREATLTSDAHGGFEWPLPEPNGAVTLTFAPAGPDTEVLQGKRTVLASDGAPQDVTVFAFLRDCEVSGTVTGADGRPIAGAWVKSSSRAAPQPCDAEGRFVVRTTATYGDTVVHAGAPGHVPQQRSTKATGRAAKVVAHFQLRAAIRLAGRVVDDTARPIAGAQVATNETHAAPAHTDAEGRYALDVDPERESHHVFVEHPEHLPTQRPVARDQLAASCDFVLVRGARVRGRVVGASDRPIADAAIRHGEFGGSGDPRAVSRADGGFELHNVDPGPGTLRVSARGYAQQRCPVTVPQDRAQVLDVVVRLTPGHFVAGRVVDQDGKGRHRVRITPRDHGGDLGPDVYTARDGAFRIVDLPEGAVTLDCFGMNLARKVVNEVAVDRDDVRIVVDPAPRLAGRVLDDATGLPIARFTVRFVTPDRGGSKPQGGGYGVEWSTGLVFEHTDGYWHTDGEQLDADHVYAIEITADGYGPAVARRLEPRVDMARDEIVLRLNAAARIAGHVVDERTAAPVRGARVAWLAAADPLAARDPAAASSPATPTGADGSFELRGVPAGDVRLVIRHPEWPLTIDGPFPTTAGATTTRRVSLPPAAALTGTVLDPHGNPVPGATVVRDTIATPSARSRSVSVEADAAGRFRFPGLAAGRYPLRAFGKLADGATVVHARTVDVLAGQETDVMLTPAGPGVLRVDLGGDDVSGPVNVFLQRWPRNPDQPPLACTTTGPTFVVCGLPAGELDVSVSRTSSSSHASGSTKVRISGGAPDAAQIRLHAHRR